VRRITAILVLTSSCGPLGPTFDPDAGEEDLWASREQIVAAAARCGVRDLEPTRAGVHWAAYVPGERPQKGPKGDCIYKDLNGQGLQVTR
jgi:hypothetical protein